MRGSIWLIRPGAAIRIGVPKVRPWLILQDDVFAAYEGRVACYLTSARDDKGKRRRMRDGQVLYTLKGHDSYICCDSLYTIKQTEFFKHVGDLDSFTMTKVFIAVSLILGSECPLVVE